MQAPEAPRDYSGTASGAYQHPQHNGDGVLCGPHTARHGVNPLTLHSSHTLLPSHGNRMRVPAAMTSTGGSSTMPSHYNAAPMMLPSRSHHQNQQGYPFPQDRSRQAKSNEVLPSLQSLHPELYDATSRQAVPAVLQRNLSHSFVLQGVPQSVVGSKRARPMLPLVGHRQPALKLPFGHCPPQQRSFVPAGTASSATFTPPQVTSNGHSDWSPAGPTKLGSSVVYATAVLAPGGVPVVTSTPVFVHFEDARELAGSDGRIKDKASWQELWDNGTLPRNVPRDPEQVYKGNGWASWPDFVCPSNRHRLLKKWRPFAQARAFVLSLGLRSSHEWVNFARTSKRPADIPSNPNRTYRYYGWCGWAHWLRDGPPHRKIARRGSKESKNGSEGTASAAVRDCNTDEDNADKSGGASDGDHDDDTNDKRSNDGDGDGVGSA